MPTPLLLAALSLTAPPAAELDLLPPGPDAGRGWEFYPGAEFPGAGGELTIGADGVLTLRYDFTQGGAYVAAYRAIDPATPLSELRLEVRKPDLAQLTLRATDSTGQVFQRPIRYEGEGWQPLVGSFSGWVHHFGGPNDGVVRQPLTRLGLLVEKTGLVEPTGQVQVRLAKATVGATEPVAEAWQGSYQVTDFSADDGFSTAGCALTDGVLRADLTTRAEASLGHSLALLGTPQELRLTIRRARPGCRLTLHLGSHFMTFGRTLGTLTGGEQTLVVPAPPTGWTWWGGSNDGVVRAPLRVARLLVERGDAPAGPVEVALGDLRCVTQTARSRAVTLLARVEDLGVTGDQRRLRVTARGWNLTAQPVTGTLGVAVRDWEERELHQATQPWTLPADGLRTDQASEVTLPAALHFAEAELRFEAPGLTPPVARGSFAAAPTDPGDATPRPESPWGMGLYLYRYPGDEAGLKRMDQAAALGRAAGVKWSREEFQWHRLEPRRGEFDFTFYDRLVETAQRHGISVYGLLGYWSNWTSKYTPEGVDDYVAWARQLVRRYKDRIHHWEIWNEPNIFFWSGPKELYPVLLTRAYRAIKEEDPTAQVLGISTAGIDTAFIQRCLDAQAPFDILTIHPYRAVLSDQGFQSELRKAAQQVGGRPVWITEMGWPTQIGGTDERTQAQLLARCYLNAVASGACQNISWYDFRNDGADPFYNEHNFGVVRGDLSPKPAYRALLTICRELADRPAPRGDFPAGVLAVGTAQAVAVWSPRAVELAVKVAGGAPRAIDLMGDELARPADSRLTVRLRANVPVVLTGGAVTDARVTPLEPVDSATVIRF